MTPAQRHDENLERHAGRSQGRNERRKNFAAALPSLVSMFSRSATMPMSRAVSSAWIRSAFPKVAAEPVQEHADDGVAWLDRAHQVPPPPGGSWCGRWLRLFQENHDRAGWNSQSDGFIGSHRPGSSVKPAAWGCPPPPSFRATCDTSKSPSALLRRLQRRRPSRSQ